MAYYRLDNRSDMLILRVDATANKCREAGSRA